MKKLIIMMMMSLLMLSIASATITDHGTIFATDYIMTPTFPQAGNVSHPYYPILSGTNSYVNGSDSIYYDEDIYFNFALFQLIGGFGNVSVGLYDIDDPYNYTIQCTQMTLGSYVTTDVYCNLTVPSDQAENLGIVIKLDGVEARSYYNITVLDYTVPVVPANLTYTPIYSATDSAGVVLDFIIGILVLLLSLASIIGVVYAWRWIKK